MAATAAAAPRGDDAVHRRAGARLFYTDRYLYEENPADLGGEPFYTRPPFYSTDPHGGPLPSPLPDGPGWLDYAPHGGTFRTANNRSSPFVLHTAADLTYEGFDLGGCGGDAAGCGLSLVGGAAIASLNASADASTAEAAAAAAAAAARAAHDATRTGGAASRGAGGGGAARADAAAQGPRERCGRGMGTAAAAAAGVAATGLAFYPANCEMGRP